MPDPVSWLMIRPGWRVVAKDGAPVGEVDEIVGDNTEDIFDGLSVATSALGAPRYVPAEQVAGITDGEVRLSLSSGEAAQLDEYLEPATSAEIEPESRGGLAESVGAEVREVEAAAAAPIQSREHRLNFIQRAAHFVRRKWAGRRQ